jgi:hypothetical protein
MATSVGGPSGVQRKRTEGLRVLSGLLGHLGKGRSQHCPFCDMMDLPVPVLCHVLGEHGQHLGLTVDRIFNKLKNLDTNFLAILNLF